MYVIAQFYSYYTMNKHKKNPMKPKMPENQMYNNLTDDKL